MAQSATTVTASNPSPPTNMSTIGWSAPDPSFFANSVYVTSMVMPGQGASAIGEMHYPYGAPGGPYATTAPYFDDGFSNTPLTLTWNETGGTDGSVKASPVNGLVFVAAHATVTDSSGPPAITTLTPEALGLEVNGNVTWAGIYLPTGNGYNHVTRIAAAGQVMDAVIRAAGPNASHASSANPTTPLTPTTSTAVGANNTANGLTTLVTVTGTNFNRYSVVYINGIKQNTEYVSATSLTVATAQKRTTAGNSTVYVYNTGSGTTTTPTINWVQT